MTAAARSAPVEATGRSGSWLVPVLVVWALGYGALRAYWTVAGAPSFPPLGFDLLAIAGWPAAAVAALVLVAALVPRAAPRRVRRVAATALAVAGGALCVSAALLLLDVIGTVFFGTRVYVEPAGALSRLATVTGGVLAVAVGRRRLRTLRVEAGGCPGCGRRTHRLAGRPVAKGERGEAAVLAPGWQRAVSWLVVVALTVRFGAQLVVGTRDGLLDLGTGQALTFLAGMAVAGTVLPLALAHTWGQVWPFWVPFLAGRRIPRWLVLGPGLGVGVGMTGYFGMVLSLVLGAVARGATLESGGLPNAFYLVAVPAYLTWGLGLLVLAVGYAARTRRPCPVRVCPTPGPLPTASRR